MDILLNALEIGAFWLADGIKWAGHSSTVWQEQPKVHGVTTAALSRLLYADSNSATCCQIIMLTCWIVMLISYLHVCLSTFHLFSHLKTFENFAAPRQWWRAYMSEIFVNGAFNKIINKSSPVYVIQFDKIFSWKVGVTFDIRHNYLTSQHDTKFTSFSDKLTRKKIMWFVKKLCRQKIWQVDLNIGQDSKKIWFVHKIIWQVLVVAELCHHTAGHK